ncbi:MAG: baseplate J/gp47 family protein [Desulfobacterium sp.]|nr:baseplate J/gp47 family protein [Desulfobacterium sp.]
MLNLSEINFVDPDTTGVEQQVITTYESISGKKLYPGDPVRLFLESLAAVISQQRALINFAGKQNLVSYATKDYLDHLGAWTDTPRLEPSCSETTVRFELSAPVAFVVLIPEGTRVTPDGNLFFATSVAGEIPAGTTSIDLLCVCARAGAVGNGFLPGQITRLVDPVAYVASVRNVTVSLGGSDAEKDDPYRNRINMAPEKYSVAGPTGAYTFWAKSAHQDIIDVAVFSPSEGVVTVVPLARGGELPGAEILDRVASLLSDRKKRPLTDKVVVQPPTQVAYDLAITYYIASSNATLASQIQARVQAAVDGFVLWQKEKLGRDINPSELIRRIQEAGAKRVEVASPAFTVLGVTEVARETSVTITYGGAEDE